jgi:hypothetical protein
MKEMQVWAISCLFLALAIPIFSYVLIVPSSSGFIIASLLAFIGSIILLSLLFDITGGLLLFSLSFFVGVVLFSIDNQPPVSLTTAIGLVLMMFGSICYGITAGKMLTLKKLEKKDKEPVKM